MAGESPDLLAHYAQARRPLEAAEAVLGLTDQWVHEFQAASGVHAQAAGDGFSLDGASALPLNIARPSLRVTPQVYKLESFSDIPYVEGYLDRDPQKEGQVFTRDSDRAWHQETPLWVDPTPLSFREYAIRTAEPNPWEDDPYLSGTLGPFWRSTPRRIADHIDRHNYDWPLGGKVPDVVYRALGVLPPVTPLTDGKYAYDLRLDPLLHNAEGEQVDSSRLYNYANTEMRYSDSHGFGTPYALSGHQAHVPSYELKPAGFIGQRAVARGWRVPPPDYHAALLLTEHMTGDRPVLLAIHLAGASALGETVEKSA